MANRQGENGNRGIIHFLGLQNQCMVTSAMKLKDTCSLEEKTHLESILKSTLPTKIHVFETMVLPVVIYGCDSWTIKKTAPKK